MEYLDFEIQVSSRKGGGYLVEVARSPMGESPPELFELRLSSIELEKLMLTLQVALLRSGNQRRRLVSEDLASIQEFGRILFDALLPAEARSRYYESRNEAYHRGHGLRIKLRIDPPELAALPWEFLYDERADAFVGMSRNSPIVRYLSLPTPIRPLTIVPPLRILAMAASPSDQDQLNTQVEKERLNRALARLEEQRLVRLDWLEGDTWRDLQGALYRNQYHVFHFVGHGYFDETNDEGIVVFCDTNGRSRRFSAIDLARLLADQTTLRLCVLNNCEGAKAGAYDAFASTAATLVRRGIPAVIAMQYDITDDAAVQLAESFYSAVASGLPVDAALSEARKGINFALPGSLEWGTPVLYMRSSDGRVFDITMTDVPAPHLGAEPATSPTPSGTLEPVTSPAIADGRNSSTERPIDIRPLRTRMGIWLTLGAILLVALIGFGLRRFWPLDGGGAAVPAGQIAPAAPNAETEGVLALAEAASPTATPTRGATPTPTHTPTPRSTPTPRATPTPSGLDYYDRGNTLMNQGHFKEAIEQFDLAQSAGYETAELFHRRGVACDEWQVNEGQCSLEQALADHTRAIELDPTNAIYVGERGWTYKLLGDLGDREAVRKSYEDYARATELDPENAMYWREFGWRAKELGNFDEALEYFDNAIELANDSGALVGRALVYRDDLGDDEQALSTFDEAVARAPKEANIFFERGMFYARLDRWAAAVDDFSRAIDLASDWVGLYAERGDAYQRLCRTDLALADYEKFLELTQGADAAEWQERRHGIQDWLENLQDPSLDAVRMRLQLTSTSDWAVLTLPPDAEILCQQTVEVTSELPVSNLDGPRLHLGQTTGAAERGSLFEVIQDLTLMMPQEQTALEFTIEMGCAGDTTVEISSLRAGKPDVVERYEAAPDACDHPTSIFVDTAQLHD